MWARPQARVTVFRGTAFRPQARVIAFIYYQARVTDCGQCEMPSDLGPVCAVQRACSDTATLRGRRAIDGGGVRTDGLG